MTQLNLRPLPTLRSDEASWIPMGEQGCFVDEEAVLALLAGPSISRQVADQGDLALAADDMDFAGWKLSAALSDRATQSSHATLDMEIRRAAPPVIEEPGIGEPHRGSHRWWLAGLAGAVSTMLFSVLLISLSSRTLSGPDEFSSLSKPARPQTGTPLKAETVKASPELSDATPAD